MNLFKAVKNSLKIKTRIDTIREELKDLRSKLPRSELKEIKKNLSNIEINLNKTKLINTLMN